MPLSSARETEVGSNPSTIAHVSPATIKYTISRRQERHISWWKNCTILNTYSIRRTLVPALPVGIKIPKPKPPPTQTQCEEKFTESYTILYLKVFNNCSLIVKLLEIPWWKVLNKSYILFIFTSVAVCLLHMTSSTNAYNEIFPLWNRYYAWIRTIFTSLG